MGEYNENILVAQDLTRRYGNTLAVDHVSLHLQRGAIYGLIGRNGAGKTTILKMIAGMIRPTQGEWELFGARGAAITAQHMLRRVGTLIESPGLQNSMTAYDNLKLKSIALGLDCDDAYLFGLLDLVGLSDVGKKKAGAFSLGMRQRLGIALALVGDPELLILDEPINGLDPQGIADTRELLLKLNRERGITILVSSHILEELSKIVTNYGILEQGKMVREFTREHLEEACADRVIVRTDTVDSAVAALRQMGIEPCKVTADTVEILGHTDETPAIIRGLVQGNVAVRTVQIGGKTLEEFFLEMIGGAVHA